jgi:phosphate:Na+ symporter
LGSFVDYLSAVVGIGATDFILKLAMFHTIFNVLGVLIMLPFIKLLEKGLLKFFTEKPDKGVDEPKFLNASILKFSSSLMLALLNESKYLYENSIFEIVTHALNIHREDIKSNLKAKQVVKQSKEDLNVDVGDLYYTKVKKIYGEIIRYATIGQSELALSINQSHQVDEIKVANRKMVEIIRDVQELSKNVTAFLNSENKSIQKEYDNLRRKIVKVLRVIYLFRTDMSIEKHKNKLSELKDEAKLSIHHSNESINKLIRENKINVDMGSSLVNDNDNVNDIIKKLIDIAELLYEKRDSLLENNS